MLFSAMVLLSPSLLRPADWKSGLSGGWQAEDLQAWGGSKPRCGFRPQWTLELQWGMGAVVPVKFKEDGRLGRRPTGGRLWCRRSLDFWRAFMGENHPL